MIDTTSGIILAITCFFCLLGFGMIVLGIYLYRRPQQGKNKDYVTEVRRPEEFPPDASARGNQPEFEQQPIAGNVHRRSGEIVPTEIGNLLDRLPANLSSRQEPILPADVSRKLESAMLNGRNHLEDVNYGKIVPNFFVVEVSPENYEKNYEPIEQQASEQWQQRLLKALNTANSRQGRKAFRFGGPVKVNVRPVSDLSNKEVRIMSQIRNEVLADSSNKAAYVERLPDGRRWSIAQGISTLGRSPRSTIYLDTADIQANRLISNEHAYIKSENGRYYIYDGTPSGKRSRNGTFVNGRGVTDSGYKLTNGDVIILASLDYDFPRPDTPGSAGFIFHTE
jgi:hypothetical protein